MKITQQTYSDKYGYHRMHVLSETKIKAVDDTAAAVSAAHAEIGPAERAWQAAIEAPHHIENARLIAADESERGGPPFDRQAWRDKTSEAAEALKDAEEDRVMMWARTQHAYAAHLTALRDHAVAIDALAAAESVAATTSLAAASRMAQAGLEKFDPAASTRGALAALLDGGDFVPVPPRAVAEFGVTGSPAVHVQLALENLAEALTYATRISDSQKAAGAVQARQRDEIIDLAPEDLYDDEDDDDE